MTVPVLTISNREPNPQTEPYYHIGAFRESCKRQGFSPIFIPCLPYRGLMSKPKFLKQYLESNSLPEVIIVTDAWDVLFLSNPSDIIYNWQAFGGKIAFNAERGYFPDDGHRSEFDVITPWTSDHDGTPYRYLNSGFFVGRADDILEMLRNMGLENAPDDFKQEDGTWKCENDQTWYHRYFLANQDKCVLDYRGILCQSLHDAGERELAFDPDRKRVVSLLTRNEPLVVHGNGTGKAWLERIIRWLGL